jgi:hypothetical protein
MKNDDLWLVVAMEARLQQPHDQVCFLTARPTRTDSHALLKTPESLNRSHSHEKGHRVAQAMAPIEVRAKNQRLVWEQGVVQRFLRRAVPTTEEVDRWVCERSAYLSERTRWIPTIVIREAN